MFNFFILLVNCLLIKNKSLSLKPIKNANFQTQFCRGSISNGFSAGEKSLKRNAWDFSIDYNTNNKSDLLNIKKYLMVKNAKLMSRLTKQEFIRLLASRNNACNHTKCIFLNNHRATQPTLIS